MVPLVATTAVEVALYILNQKRAHLKDIEARYRIPITVTADEDMHISQFVIERGAEGAVLDGESTVVHMDWAHHRESPAAPAVAPSPAAPPCSGGTAEGDGEQRRGRGRRRRRKRHGEGGAEGHRAPQYAGREMHEPQEAEDDEASDESIAAEARAAEAERRRRRREGAQQRKGPRRRGRRGGRRGRSGQRPDQAPGEAGAQGEPRAMRAERSDRESARDHPASDHATQQAPADRKNGDARPSRPRPEESFAHESEPVLNARSQKERRAGDKRFGERST